MIEVHNDPEAALCDGPQSMTPEGFDALMKKIRKTAEFFWKDTGLTGSEGDFLRKPLLQEYLKEKRRHTNGESLHIGAEKGEIADIVFMPGDPLRAKFIAENFLEDARCYTQVRNMLGYTGTYKGTRVSVQGSGMGMPSMGIYSHELIEVYGCRNIIRIGSAGSYQEHVNLGDIVIASSASTDSRFRTLTIFREAFLHARIFIFFMRAYHRGGIVSSGQDRQCGVGRRLFRR